MTVDQMILTIQAYLNEMEDLLDLAGVKESHRTLNPNTSRFTEEEVTEAFDFISDFRIDVFEPANEVYKQHGPDVWRRFEAAGIMDLYEQQILKHHFQPIREAWKNRPKMFKSKRKAKPE